MHAQVNMLHIYHFDVGGVELDAQLLSESPCHAPEAVLVAAVREVWPRDGIPELRQMDLDLEGNKQVVVNVLILLRGQLECGVGNA